MSEIFLESLIALVNFFVSTFPPLRKLVAVFFQKKSVCLRLYRAEGKWNVGYPAYTPDDLHYFLTSYLKLTDNREVTLVFVLGSRLVFIEQGSDDCLFLTSWVFKGVYFDPSEGFFDFYAYHDEHRGKRYLEFGGLEVNFTKHF